MDNKEFFSKLDALPEETPDDIDLEMITLAQRESGDASVPMAEFMETLERSGKLNIRIPKTLHAKLAEQSKKEGVSLNQFIIYKLAQ